MIRCTIALVLLITGFAHAEVIIVPTDYPTIQQAINAASDGDEILVQAGTYPEPLTVDGVEVSITAISGSKLTVIDVSDFPGTYAVSYSGGTGSLASIDGFTLRGSIGGVSINNSTPAIRNCVIEEVTTYGILVTGTAAAAIQIVGCQLIGIDDSEFGVYVNAAADVIIEQTTVQGWSSGVRHLNGDGELTILDSSLANNGWALYVTDSSTNVVRIERTDFHDNSNSTGAAMHLQQRTDVTAIDCTFRDNTGTSSGGAVYVSNQNVISLDGCLFESNSTTGAGGAIRIENNENSVLVSNTEFRFNTALGDGGAIRNEGPATYLSLQESLFCANSVPQVSGAWTNLGGNEFSTTCQPVGGCCFAGTCHVLSAEACAAAGGTYFGDDTTCDDIECLGCASDVDGDGVVGFTDLISILSDWGPCP